MSKFLKKIENEMLWTAPHKMAHEMLYNKFHGKKINWEDPGTYDELIHYFILNLYDESYGKYADKYQVRGYVKECGLENILIPLLGGPYDSFDQIDFNSLPDEFVIKTNHASGSAHYYICKDKKNIPMDRLKVQFANALKDNYAKHFCQYHYNSIRPCIVIEELLHDKKDRMTDYKVVCSYGTPIAILVCSNRSEGRDYYDLEWNHLDYTLKKFQSGEIDPRPAHLEEMLRAASVLSSQFPLARIDFYDTDSGLYFGEITLTPSAGQHRNLSDEGQTEIAKKIKQCCRDKHKYFLQG